MCDPLMIAALLPFLFYENLGRWASQARSPGNLSRVGSWQLSARMFGCLGGERSGFTLGSSAGTRWFGWPMRAERSLYVGNFDTYIGMPVDSGHALPGIYGKARR